MSTVAQQQGIRRRFPRQYPGLESDIQPVPVNSRYTPPLKNIELLEVAHIFSRLECRILQGSAQVLQNHTLNEDQREPDEQQRLIRLEKAGRDLLDVHGGKYQFSVGYHIQPPFRQPHPFVKQKKNSTTKIRQLHLYEIWPE
ncbi:hypothetical protein FOXYSP1_12993 [Fusarium oxysporum f. sp. phaseoli]